LKQGGAVVREIQEMNCEDLKDFADENRFSGQGNGLSPNGGKRRIDLCSKGLAKHPGTLKGQAVAVSPGKNF
jgi:hypothetical protein